jgi:hypothetical protein
VSILDRLMIGWMLAAAALVAGVLELRHYGAERYQAGYQAAVDAGKEARDTAATAALAIESGLRARLLEQDFTALRKEQEYATNLDAAQRRVRAGVDSLRCPSASPVPGAAAAGDRPAAGAPAADGPGPELVPEAAADVLGYGAAIAGLVSRYAEVVERHEACRTVNAVP